MCDKCVRRGFLRGPPEELAMPCAWWGRRAPAQVKLLEAIDASSASSRAPRSPAREEKPAVIDLAKARGERASTRTDAASAVWVPPCGCRRVGATVWVP